MTGGALIGYYGRRASEYESIYEKPERQSDLARIRELLPRELSGHDVLEIACGTGYWTAILAPAARSIVAVDASPDVLAIAMRKPYPPGRARFVLDDALELREVRGRFTAGLAAFWWSHLPRRRLTRFLERFHSLLPGGAPVVLIDNRYVEGSSTPISRRDEDGNSYQRRRLADGSEHEVLKNFPSPAELRACLATFATEIRVRELGYFWCISYRVSKST